MDTEPPERVRPHRKRLPFCRTHRGIRNVSRRCDVAHSAGTKKICIAVLIRCGTGRGEVCEVVR
jgi:hypothetical protein